MLLEVLKRIRGAAKSISHLGGTEAMKEETRKKKEEEMSDANHWR